MSLAQVSNYGVYAPSWLKSRIRLLPGNYSYACLLPASRDKQSARALLGHAQRGN